MNQSHRVPEFEMEDDYSIPTPSGYPRPKKSAATGEDEEIMELLWQNGQVVMHSQNQRRQSKKNTSFGGGEVVEREIRSGGCGEEQHHLFMQEDEMASWLQYPLDDDSSFDYADLLYSAPPPPPPPTTAAVAPPRAAAEIRPPPAPPRPPIPSPAPPRPPIPSPAADNAAPRVQNFMHFSRIPIRPRAEPMMNRQQPAAARESTVVESNETPLVAPESRVVSDSRPQVNADCRGALERRTSGGPGELAAEHTVTTSSGSRASFSASGEPHQQRPAAAKDRKRKATEADNNECQSEDIEFEAAEAKKQARGSASTKRSRAAEVHNLSERRRRDRINEKMRALQELIPRCNKSDKASMLDEAIEYLKSLQLQVQMMSMGCGMVPMMYPGMQQYMPTMGMGMGMGMGMEMGMGMNRPMVPYPSMLPGSAMPNTAAAAHMGPRFPMPAFQMQPVPPPVQDPSRVAQASNQTTNHVPTPVVSHNQNQPRIPNFVDPYQQFLGLHQVQLQVQQNQAVLQSGSNKASTSKEIGRPDNQQSEKAVTGGGCSTR